MVLKNLMDFWLGGRDVEVMEWGYFISLIFLNILLVEIVEEEKNIVK